MCEVNYFPSKVARSKKIMTQTYESENIYIEYELEKVPLSQQAALIEKVNAKMEVFLDLEEKKIRDKYGEPDRNPKKKYPPKQSSGKTFNGTSKEALKQYDIEITSEGEKLQELLTGEFKIVKEDKGDYKNFIHLWLHISQKLYIGHLHRIKGTLKFKEENIDKIRQLNIKEGFHFKIIDKTEPLIAN